MVHGHSQSLPSLYILHALEWSYEFCLAPPTILNHRRHSPIPCMVVHQPPSHPHSPSQTGVSPSTTKAQAQFQYDRYSLPIVITSNLQPFFFLSLLIILPQLTHMFFQFTLLSFLQEPNGILDHIGGTQKMLQNTRLLGVTSIPTHDVTTSATRWFTQWLSVQSQYQSMSPPWRNNSTQKKKCLTAPTSSFMSWMYLYWQQLFLTASKNSTVMGQLVTMLEP